jgi:hypothetical protein
MTIEVSNSEINHTKNHRKHQRSSRQDNFNFNDLSGVVTAFDDGDSDKFLVLDVYHPPDFYVSSTLTRALANSIYGGTIAIQFCLGKF